ncbi:MAG: undecaprenyl-diphosphatase, partial [Proteobacteria bacterium]|nr:undecaprenyl-diphosphatase [Pseudomonadota bacterium]
MTGINLVVLALIQGITEFLPVSSSAHLILVPVFTDWPDQGPMIDVALHVGTLGAVLVYFHRDVWAMLRGISKLED